MADIKPGDRVRVHVDLEAEVTYVNARDGMADVRTDDGDRFSMHTRWFAVIVPPIAVGDVVTAENVGQLPVRSVVAEPGYVAMELLSSDSSVLLPWHATNGNAYSRTEAVGATVLRVGGGS